LPPLKLDEDHSLLSTIDKCLSIQHYNCQQLTPSKNSSLTQAFFTRKLRARSNSISSAASNASASAASVKSSGNTSDEGGRGGKKFVPGGIVLARAGAAVGVSTGSTVEELEDAERRRQRRLRRGIASS